ncbi:MAG TPA: hypothetical protein IAA29_14855, partial [Candidatus Paenibacillus intestinavium]|nr:hypothetical protein [Candidatus Paenibacillus intestinavium]
IEELGEQPKKMNILFNERNEWAKLLVEYKRTKKTARTANDQFEQLMKSRTNELLDLYLLAQSLQDQDWLDSIVRKLTQLGAQTKPA